jgi:hypothetical protein
MFSVAPLFLPKGPVKTAWLWRPSVPDIILRWGDRKRRSERCNPGPGIELAWIKPPARCSLQLNGLPG